MFSKCKLIFFFQIHNIWKPPVKSFFFFFFLFSYIFENNIIVMLYVLTVNSEVFMGNYLALLKHIFNLKFYLATLIWYLIQAKDVCT